MLKTLTVWNFALLEHVQVEFGKGLNILTGETGAGKSILIDALGGVLGRRLPASLIRTGCDSLRLEAVFTLDDSPFLRDFLRERAIDESEGILIIKRQVGKNGRGLVLVNDSHVTLATLRELGTLLFDIHGQNENLALLKESSQLKLVDDFSDELSPLLKAYQEAYALWRAAKERYEKKELNAREFAQRLDMLRWQDKEISEAHLKEKEDEVLEAKINKLSHAEKISKYVSSSAALLEGGGRQGPGVMAALAEIKRNLTAMSRYDDGLANALKIVEEAEISLQEAAYEVQGYAEGMDFSPQKLDSLQARMDVIDRLCKKYGANVREVLEYQQHVQKELAELESYDSDMETLKKDIKRKEQVMREAGQRLSQEREATSQRLGEVIREQLLALGMPKARLRVTIRPLGKYSQGGMDAAEIFFSANPGEAEKPLSKVASGGELSRIALAIKTVAASRDVSVPSMVFDEIDTGIGGCTARMVAERIALVSRCTQVLCITHLAQIACMADNHIYIAKSSGEDGTVTRVRTLSEHERVREIARMASGADLTTASLENAREMVSHARLKKESLAAKGA